MLVLTMKLEDEVMIGDDIIVQLKRVDGCRVRIGVDAPASVKIMRRKLYEELKAAEIAGKEGEQ